MPDNFQITAGSGTTIRAVQKSGIDAQVVVLDVGGAGTENLLTMATADATITGAITVTTSGTPVQGGNISNPNGFIIKAHPDNTDTVWFMYHGQAKSVGYPLNPGEQAPVPVSNLNLLDFDADVSGESLRYVKE